MKYIFILLTVFFFSYNSIDAQTRLGPAKAEQAKLIVTQKTDTCLKPPQKPEVREWYQEDFEKSDELDSLRQVNTILSEKLIQYEKSDNNDNLLRVFLLVTIALLSIQVGRKMT